MAASISCRKNTLYFENKLSSLDELTKILTKEAEGAGTKAMHTAEDMLEARNADSGMPYGPQSVRELGCVGMDYGWVSGTFLTDYFLNTDYYSTETSQLIQKTIKAFL